jgi:hypothetical protein
VPGVRTAAPAAPSHAPRLQHTHCEKRRGLKQGVLGCFLHGWLKCFTFQ